MHRVVSGLLALALTTSGAAAAATPVEVTPFASAVFRATHNSYSGNVDGTKGSITQQLDAGVRFIELDIYTSDFGTLHDYAIGHSGPGDAVDHAGNPASNALRDWLRVINDWSAAHPSHAPLTVMLDLKNDLTSAGSPADGNATALNQELRAVFGSRLLLAKDNAALPTVESARGRVLALLSGDRTSRLGYRHDSGRHPAVAINSRGQVVEVHDSGGGDLWLWTGTYGSDGRITWNRHERYDTGTTPAVALNDQSLLVEVHKSETADTLWYHVGRLGADGAITWSASRKYDSGVQPTVRFTSPGGSALREVHRSQSGSQNWEWKGALDAGALSVSWTGNARTSDPLPATNVSASGSAKVTVSTGSDGTSPADTLRASTDRAAAENIRYEQLAFVEYQPDDGTELQRTALFYAAPSSNTSFITEARKAGHVVRGWDFDDPGRATTPLANYPATNHPDAAWYVKLMADAHAVR
ncbi:hypothetical protein BC739_000350 [Kutzneria viridogrisea]|uniref:1-phosphatidylinositol phosphodiesterase n=1 Tax=Kutzneria viridogrisea TaxID=47990 RepID=A0ABR6B8H7_9PSEU|nr:hypothetical protein [Kutzneria viridogrisea]